MVFGEVQVRDWAPEIDLKIDLKIDLNRSIFRSKIGDNLALGEVQVRIWSLEMSR